MICRMDEENADNVEQAVSKELCMPIVLRSVAAGMNDIAGRVMAWVSLFLLAVLDRDAS